MLRGSTIALWHAYAPGVADLFIIHYYIGCWCKIKVNPTSRSMPTCH